MTQQTLLSSPSIYTDVQGLESLHRDYKKNPAAARRQVAEQFESLLIQMLLKSMRDAYKECSSELSGSQQSSFYYDWHDKQLALTLAQSGMGIADNIEQYLNHFEGVETQKVGSMALNAKEIRASLGAIEKKDALVPTFVPKAQDHAPVSEQQTLSVADLFGLTAKLVAFDKPADFVQHLWGFAKTAAARLGLDPKILLAQAALETNWGKKIIQDENGQSSHNLFNIKAGKKWPYEVAVFHSLEEKDGILVKEKASFRAYPSYEASFMDYAHFLKSNPRYHEALLQTGSPQAFVQALQAASYASDHLYAEKIMDIFSSKKFNDLFAEFT